MGRTAHDQEQLNKLSGERIAAVAALPKPTVAAYERIRKKWRGAAIAEVVDGRCSQCQITLRPQYFQEIRRGDTLMTCESCGRFLFYNPSVKVAM